MQISWRLNLVLVVLASLGSVAIQPLQGEGVIYSNDFSGAAGAEWSTAITSETPVGNRPFLGEFSGSDATQLNLLDLPGHTNLTISFELFIIRSWDGTATNGQHSDTFTLAVVGGPTLLHASFDDTFQSPGARFQSYPGTFPGSLNPSYTGAAETNTLGYEFSSPGVGAVASDSVYRVSFTFAHTGNTVAFSFAGDLDQANWDESWGLAHVVVRTDGAVIPLECGVAELCPCDGPRTGGRWADHHEYVDCVAATTKALVKAHLLTQTARTGLVKQAQQSNCGQ